MILFKDLSTIMIPSSLSPYFIIICIHMITSHPNLVYLARAHFITKTRFDLTEIIRLQGVILRSRISSGFIILVFIILYSYYKLLLGIDTIVTDNT